MKIKLTEITVRDLTEGYEDNDEEGGVIGFSGKLDIRPPHQREFVYGDKERDAVIDSLTNNFPLGVMYWAVKDNGDFEIIDGQQRTVSISQYINGDFSFRNDFADDMRYFDNLQDDEKEKFLDYKLTVYLCSGSNSDKLQWFKTINIAGKPLTDQELKNAVFSGTWVSDAKRYFSKNGCAAYQIGKDYLKGNAIRQEYLETVINWISEGDIDRYMGKHQPDKDAIPLWEYFQDVISWVEATFTTKRKIMKGVDWGTLYNQFKDKVQNAQKIEEETVRLLLDDDISKQSGIYPYILTRKEKYLSIRAFTDPIKLRVYTKQNGICPICGKHFALNKMHADHITPWHDGGKTTEENCQMLCRDDNLKKSGK